MRKLARLESVFSELRKAKPDPRRKQLEKLIQKRANLDANDVQGNLELSAQIRALRTEMREPVQSDGFASDGKNVNPTLFTQPLVSRYFAS